MLKALDENLVDAAAWAATGNLDAGEFTRLLESIRGRPLTQAETAEAVGALATAKGQGEIRGMMTAYPCAGCLSFGGLGLPDLVDTIGGDLVHADAVLYGKGGV